MVEIEDGVAHSRVPGSDGLNHPRDNILQGNTISQRF